MDDLTAAELEVMQILWEFGELKPQEVLQHHPREISNSTLRTFLTDLVGKGHVTRTKRGKVFYYQAQTARTSAFRLRVQHLVTSFAGGSYLNLARELIGLEEFPADQLEELRRGIDLQLGTPSLNAGGA
ncbi:MAG: BlaI/MecI/CopY family transcriptional regulator [Pirellulales bacterium]|nr:BlaI/MecI/CopY family transcriptional regulator [Pirellulales bacterium]